MTDRPDMATMAAEVARCAMLSPLEYDHVREEVAARLGIRVSTLDDEVKRTRPMPEAADGRGVALPMHDPWDEPVDAAELLSSLARAIRRHVIVPQATADAIALWIAHTWVFGRFQHTPRLAIRSPVKRCGKTTLLDVLDATCCRPLRADNISASGVFRVVEALTPGALLIDEADSFLRDNEELRGILNSGFKAEGEVIRVAEVKGEHQPLRFSTYAPCAIAAIGELPSTIEDRALPVALQRKAAAETVVKLRAPGARAGLAALGRKLARWAQDAGGALPDDPVVPDALGDREGDIVVPLLSIADHAGGEWPARARAALLAVFRQRNATDAATETGALLLRDIRDLFLGTSALRMPSAEIAASLGKMEERPWAEWRQGKPITAPQLANALRPFGIRPGTIRQGTETVKGYYRDAFGEAWARYLTPDTPSSPHPPVTEPSHRHNQGNSRDSEDLETVTPDPVLRPENPRKAAENKGCDGVTAENPPPREEGVNQTGWRAEL